MENNDKPLSEFEKMVNEATGEIPKINQSSNESGSIELDDITVVEDNSVPELPKTNEVKQEPVVTNETPTEVQKQTNETSTPVTPEVTNTSTLPKETTLTNNKVQQNNNAQTIGTIKPDKQKSPIAMIFLFGLLLVFIIFMPPILDFVNKNFGTNFDAHTGTKVETPEPSNKEDDKQKIEMYPLAASTVINVDKVSIGGFTKNDDGTKLSFYVKNNGTIIYKFEKKLYLEYYDANNTFVGRSYLESIKEVTGGVQTDYSIDISSNISNSATQVELVQRTDDDYPNVTLTNNILTCSNADESLIYTFNDSSRLTKIRDTYTYTKPEDSFQFASDKINYTSRVASLNAMDGITAIISDTDTGFMTVIDIDYQSADYSKISSNTNYYVKDTYAKVISFEMNAKNYTCK